MRTSPTLIAIDQLRPTCSLQVSDAIRTLLSLVGTPDADTEAYPPSSTSEEILVDAEVDGSRYLLVRMAQPASCKVRLSPREQEIVRMVAKGHPNKVIADVLNISSWTVCTHLRRIFAKLGVGSRAAMVAQLLENGTLPQNHNRASNLR
jgi:DNA-binding CsgD family transcriptional regulator